MAAASLIASSWIAAASTAAAEVPPPPGEDRPVDRAVYYVLEQHCARCHQVGALKPDLNGKPEDDFGNVMNLEQIAADADKIIRGNAEVSDLFKQIKGKKMPLDRAKCGRFARSTSKKASCEEEQKDVSEQELTALRCWIEQLGGSSCGPEQLAAVDEVLRNADGEADRPTAVAKSEPPGDEPESGDDIADATPDPAVPAPRPVCASSTVIADRDIIPSILQDLDQVPRHRRATTRYLTLHNLYNLCAAGQLPQADFEAAPQALAKLLNSVSMHPEPVRLVRLGPSAAVLRFHLEDIRWSAADWETLLAFYPYRGFPRDNPHFEALQGILQTRLPYLRADWVVASASQPPLYDALLKLPEQYIELQKRFGIDVDANIRSYDIKRAGFTQSGVSDWNRLIERHSLPTGGYFWASYDFGDGSGRKNLKAVPTGPGAELGYKGDGFEHDGGEVIFSLPNDFQAYYLNKADGTRIAFGPPHIVRDPDGPGGSVVNGLSCMNCHEAGMRLPPNEDAIDEVRQHILIGAFDQELREEVAATYMDQKAAEELLERDRSRFETALRRADIEPGTKFGGREMIYGLARRYEQDLQLPQHAAAELGMPLEEFERRARSAPSRIDSLTRQLLDPAAKVKRELFESHFAELAQDLAGGDIVDVSRDETRSGNALCDAYASEESERMRTCKFARAIGGVPPEVLAPPPQLDPQEPKEPPLSELSLSALRDLVNGGGQRAGAARNELRRRDTDAFETAKASPDNRYSVLNAYLSDFPDGEFRLLAISEIKRREDRDDAAFARVRSSNDLTAAVDRYLRDFPEGRHRAEAPNLRPVEVARAPSAPPPQQPPPQSVCASASLSDSRLRQTATDSIHDYYRALGRGDASGVINRWAHPDASKLRRLAQSARSAHVNHVDVEDLDRGSGSAAVFVDVDVADTGSPRGANYKVRVYLDCRNDDWKIARIESAGGRSSVQRQASAVQTCVSQSASDGWLRETATELVLGYYRALGNRDVNGVISRWHEPNTAKLRQAVSSARWATVNSAYVEDLDRRSGTAIVYADVDVADTRNPRGTNYRLRIRLSCLDDWKIVRFLQ